MLDGNFLNVLQFSYRAGCIQAGRPVPYVQRIMLSKLRIPAFILGVAATAACGAAMAQTTTPNVVTPTPGLQTPLTSTTTNCMMTCNSQAANCQAACLIPPPPINAPGPPPNLNPATAATVAPIFNTTGNTACLMGCTSNQLACQSVCAQNSPFSLGARHFYLFDQHRVIRICL